MSCIIAIERKAIVVLFICCVKHGKFDISWRFKGKDVTQRIHCIFTCNQGETIAASILRWLMRQAPQTLPVASLLLRVMHMESKGDNITHPSVHPFF